MRERPILFSAPMVRAILEGRKTQTRRTCRDQHLPGHKPSLLECPYGKPGDRLWVREAHALEQSVDGNAPPFSDGRPIKRAPNDDFEGIQPAWTQAHYRATDPDPDLCCERDNCAQCRDHDMGPHWRPSIHMPRWASRITLEVTGVRVERLTSLSESDAEQEGLNRIEIGSGYLDRYAATATSWQQAVEQAVPTYEDPRNAFRDLWESINGAGSWAANPWVLVVEFCRIEQPRL